MGGNMLQGRSCSDLQWTAIVYRPTLAFCFSNKCVRLECKCAVSVSALWPRKRMLLKAQLISRSTCVGCVTFFLINLFLWWPCWVFWVFFLFFSVFSQFWCPFIGGAQTSRFTAEENIHKRAIQQLLCLQAIVRDSHSLDLSLSVVSMCMCSCAYCCLLNLSKKLPQLFMKMFAYQAAQIVPIARLLVFLPFSWEGNESL